MAVLLLIYDKLVFTAFSLHPFSDYCIMTYSYPKDKNGFFRDKGEPKNMMGIICNFNYNLVNGIGIAILIVLVVAIVISFLILNTRVKKQFLVLENIESKIGSSENVDSLTKEEVIKKEQSEDLIEENQIEDSKGEEEEMGKENIDSEISVHPIGVVTKEEPEKQSPVDEKYNTGRSGKVYSREELASQIKN